MVGFKGRDEIDMSDRGKTANLCCESEEIGRKRSVSQGEMKKLTFASICSLFLIGCFNFSLYLSCSFALFLLLVEGDHCLALIHFDPSGLYIFF